MPDHRPPLVVDRPRGVCYRGGGPYQRGAVTNTETAPPMTLEELRAFIAGHAWRRASTMPHIPHEYTLRAKADDEAAFLRFVVHIRQHGYRGRFGKTTYTYLDVDGYQYWTMGAPLATTILINRAEKKS